MDNPNIVPMVEFMTDVAWPKDMSKLIDEVMYDYAAHKLDEGLSEDGVKKVQNNMYLLRGLRDVFDRM